MNSSIYPTIDMSNTTSNSLLAAFSNMNTPTLHTHLALLPSFTGDGTLVTRYDEEFFETAYPEEEDLPGACPSFYEGSPDTIWIRNSKHSSFFQRGDCIRFPLSRELPEDKDLVVDCLEFFLYETGDTSGLTIELYLDNRKVMSIPYNNDWRISMDMKSSSISEKDRTLSLRKNLMVKFKKNGSPYREMGIGYVSPGKPVGHVKGRLKTRTRLLPQSTCQCLTDHNKNITGLADNGGHLVATWDYDAFGNIIHQTGSLANHNPLRFSSEYHDEDLGLIYYNYRHYNPREGRWISRDPIGESSGNNLYGFVENNPANDHDYWGLFYSRPPLSNHIQPLGVPNGSSQWGGWAPPLLPGDIFPSKGNCYRYACNKPVKYPEDEHDANPEGFTDFSAFTCENLLAGAKAQGAKSIENGKCPKCFHKAMLYISPPKENRIPVNDFHWYKQDTDGSWSHKPGEMDVYKNLIHPFMDAFGRGYNISCGEICISYKKMNIYTE